MFMSTMTMHDPYLSHNISGSSQLNDTIRYKDSRDKEYLERLNYFDRILGKFLDKTKEAGLYDNTLVVIAGDHEISEDDIPDYLNDKYVPVIILNSPLTGVPAETDITQLDVFPTILDMMNQQYEYLGVEYKGLGTSIFSTSKGHHIPSEEDYKISEWIIKSKERASQ